MVVSHVVLKVLAGLVWYVGGVVLVWKGGTLLAEAEALYSDSYHPWLAAAGGVLLGGVKGKYLFTRNCRKNLRRIEALRRPRVWQFFAPRFFFMLALMISLGATLSRLAHGNYLLLNGVGMLDLSIGVALLGSSYVFWQREPRP